MADLTDAEAADLREIASPAVNGIPGAWHGAALDGLMSKGMVEVGVVPSAPPITDASAWVRPTDTGLAWLAENPA